MGAGTDGEFFASSFAPFKRAVLAAGRTLEDCSWSAPSPGTLAFFGEGSFFQPGGFCGDPSVFSAAAHAAYVTAFTEATSHEH